MKTSFITILFFSFSVALLAQENMINDTLTRTATITYKIKGNTVEFSPVTPPLNQIAGAPKAFYNHFWEFGDGDYSKVEKPIKNYQNTGEYEVKYWATNMYDTGKPPTTRPKKLKIDTVETPYNEEASMTEDLTLIRNREPMPSEDMVIVMSYKNSKAYATNGKLLLYFNEAKYKANNFELVDMRTYHDEKNSPVDGFVFSKEKNEDTRFYASAESAIQYLKAIVADTTEREDLELTKSEAETTYKNAKALEFSNMKPNEERHVFFTFKTTPEMLKDTSAIISVRSIYIPDEAYKTHKVKDMEMEIVTSHDPNKMSSNATFLNYRLVRFKRPQFKIRFQNNGEGPARTIRLETDIPKMFDKTTIQVEDMYPKCKICPKQVVQYSCLDTTFTETQAIFTFKNIYLPGSEQKNVKDYDSTKGFVKYSLKFGKDFHKVKTKSRTAIIFDKNDPIITNYSTTRFLPGVSVGVKTGYNAFSDLKNSTSYFIGATISPYKSYKWYWQAELLNSFHRYESETSVTEGLTDSPAGEQQFERITTNNSYKTIDWEFPLLARYTINNYLGIGAGLQGMVSLNEKRTEQILIENFENINTQPGALILTNERTEETNDSFSNFRSGFLVEATAGFARIGPSVGARYVFSFKEQFNYLQFYALWKF